MRIVVSFWLCVASLWTNLTSSSIAGCDLRSQGSGSGVCAAALSMRMMVLLWFDQPDRAVGSHRHADGRALRPDAVHLVPFGDELSESRGRDLGLSGLKCPARISRATDAIADRRRADLRKTLVVDVVEDDAAAGRPVAVESDHEFALQLRELAAAVIEHRQRRRMRRQQRQRGAIERRAGA